MKMRRLQRPRRRKPLHRRYPRRNATAGFVQPLPIVVDDPNDGGDLSEEAREKVRVWFEKTMSKRIAPARKPEPDLIAFGEMAARALGIELTAMAREVLRQGSVMVPPRSGMGGTAMEGRR